MVGTQQSLGAAPSPSCPPCSQLVSGGDTKCGNVPGYSPEAPAEPAQRCPCSPGSSEPQRGRSRSRGIWGTPCPKQGFGQRCPVFRLTAPSPALAASLGIPPSPARWHFAPRARKSNRSQHRVGTWRGQERGDPQTPTPAGQSSPLPQQGHIKIFSLAPSPCFVGSLCLLAAFDIFNPSAGSGAWQQKKAE